MRSQRVVVWLGTFIFVSLILIFVRSSNSSPDTSSFSPLPDPRPSADLQRPELPLNEQLLQQSTYHKVSTPAGKHPIAALSENASQEFDQVRTRQSKTLSQAVKEYRRRYGMHPPPHFDKWFQFAQAKGVQLIDEYDTIYHSLLPFWALEPKTIRGRAHETLGFDNSMIGVLVRNGSVSLTEGGTDEQKWQRSATAQMISSFAEYLPDMDLVFNAHDEPRVIVPSEDLQRLVMVARERAIPDASLTETPKNAWSDRPSDLNKGDRIDEVRTTRFSRFSHQSTWSYSRSSCPVDSPVRSLVEDPADDIDMYALGELGFIANTTAFTDICNTPSLRHTYGFFDRPNTFEVVHDLFPVFSQSKISSYQDILYPSPWYYADKVPYEAARDFDWNSKLDKMYWRGSTTGGYSRAGGWRRQHRQRFVRNVNARDTANVLTKREDGQWTPTEIDRSSLTDLFDIHFTYIGQCDAEDCTAQREYFGVAESVDQQDAWANRHLVDIDGNAFSGRFYAFLRSKSLVYKISIFREWHDEWLKPWAHYVPLRLTGDDYLEAVRYFTEDEEGATTAPRIAQNSPRNRLWDLSQSWAGFRHHILTLRSGFKFHYVCNDGPGHQPATDLQRPLVVFIHGFPDSWAIWRHILASPSLQHTATLVAVDLPGYGGSDRLERYSATKVLENLTEFVIAIRAKYGADTDTTARQRKVIIVGHDWGCVLSTRLASEAPQLADRFILTNGPIPGLAQANIARRLSSSLKMLKTALRDPIHSRATLWKVVHTLQPVGRQLLRSGYIFAMKLPLFLVRYLGRGGNYSFLKLVHRSSYGQHEFSPRDAAECMASTVGPSMAECETQTAEGDTYPAAIKADRGQLSFQHMTAYYRDNTAFGRWNKSIETIAHLHSIEDAKVAHRTSSGAGLFADGPKGSLKASATIIWGKADIALEPALCLDGISDYLVRDSQVIVVPGLGHFTPLERQGQLALEKALEWTGNGEKEDIGAIIYDELIPVNPLTNLTPANLWLMDRPDLIATFTKIELWRQTQFKRIVYLDCDIVAVRAPDELLELDVEFAAAPDVGWPDCFNSGVMVLRPNLQDYFALRALAERGISFDGADQGLLNMHFRDWHRLSFTYNCTPSANYQYIPAYNHFQSTISMIHFIGAQKPWNMGRQVQPVDSPYNKLLGRWWAVYDSHYRPVVSVPHPEHEQRAVTAHDTGSVPVQSSYGAPERSHAHVHQQGPIDPPRGEAPHEGTPKGSEPHPVRQGGESYYEVSHHDREYQGTPRPVEPYTGPADQGGYGTAQGGIDRDDGQRGSSHHEVTHRTQEHHWEPHHEATHHGVGHHEGMHREMEPQAGPVHVPPPFRSAVPQYVRGEEHVAAYIHPHTHQTSFSVQAKPAPYGNEGSGSEAWPEQSQSQAHQYYQPAEPLPESQHGLPSPKPEVQPSFEPPKAEWDASKEPPPLNTRPEGFALETKTYTMSEDQQLFQPPPSYPEAPKNMYYDVPSTRPEPEKLAQLFPWESHAPRPTRVFPEDDQISINTIPRSLLESTAEEEPGPSLQSRDTTWTWASEEPAESWEHYTRSNAWDEVPEIQRYISSMQQVRKGRVQVLTGPSSSTEARDVRITDFPSEQERPSLPVTPAPIRRRPGERAPSDDDLLPSAQGIPSQEDWNPSAGLEELRIRRSEVLDHPGILFDRILSSSSITSDQMPPPGERTND
ncbi:uncharacterized protein BP01DRAFT_375623 [Aspergillus saccharolyticus JOP 1030-1]|uniref:glycogenin glucosyltransferase n=1 Tax=Aspergillus saccharolyticus JOP 1030-1 TaxID=1450539 RepID=A0A318Z7T6_9EURO|nr:hypothetical protein BP01DRAFT_375623 [Aspergillus saccharolyticus JOP 1030-1]PYH43246.1 hypothetical protein BP01DRAFT_375623 [Aspergillus saccharolyticus JOP 1030-1]